MLALHSLDESSSIINYDSNGFSESLLNGGWHKFSAATYEDHGILVDYEISEVLLVLPNDVLHVDFTFLVS